MAARTPEKLGRSRRRNTPPWERKGLALMGREDYLYNSINLFSVVCESP